MKQLHQESLERLKSLEFGQPVTNICAGENNPLRLAYFVSLDVKRHTNKYGVIHTEHLAKCTDNKGKFWRTGIDVVYPGHLEIAECERLFAPVHAAMFGAAPQEKQG